MSHDFGESNFDFKLGAALFQKTQVHSGSPAVPWCGISVAGKLDACYASKKRAFGDYWR